MTDPEITVNFWEELLACTMAFGLLFGGMLFGSIIYYGS